MPLPINKLNIIIFLSTRQENVSKMEKSVNKTNLSHQEYSSTFYSKMV